MQRSMERAALRHRQILFEGNDFGTTGTFTNTPQTVFVPNGAAPQFMLDEEAIENALADIRELEAEIEAPAKKNSAFESDEKGQFITSDRTFGVEFEINFQNDRDALAGAIGEGYHLDHDGSVRRGVEVVSPVLRGKAGEDQVLKTCETITKHGGDTDDSCGLHIHLGAKDFFNGKEAAVIPLAKALTQCKEKGYKASHYYIMHESAIESLLESTSGERLNLAHALIDKQAFDVFRVAEFIEALNSKSLQVLNVMFSGLPNSRAQNFHLVIARRKNGPRSKPTLKVVNLQTEKEIQGYRGKPVSFLSVNNYALITPEVSRKLLAVRVPAETQDIYVSRLKRVAAFVVAFDDVIASMLPLERRDNDYAKRLDQKISIEDLMECNSLIDIFKAYMHIGPNGTMGQARRESRHSSRYCGFNLHALLKHGTIEIRYHAGTIAAHKVLHWIVLWQAILDLAKDTDNPRCKLDNLLRASMIVNLAQKTDLFFKKLKLPPDTENYFRARINEFKDDDRAIFEDCMLIDEGNARHF